MLAKEKEKEREGTRESDYVGVFCGKTGSQTDITACLQRQTGCSHKAIVVLHPKHVRTARYHPPSSSLAPVLTFSIMQNHSSEQSDIFANL